MATSDNSVDLRRAVAGGGPWWRSIPVQLAGVEIGANALAGVTTFVFLQYLYPSGHTHAAHAGAVITLAFIIYLACALPVGAAINARLFLPVARWRAADRPGDARNPAGFGRQRSASAMAVPPLAQKETRRRTRCRADCAALDRRIGIESSWGPAPISHGFGPLGNQLRQLQVSRGVFLMAVPCQSRCASMARSGRSRTE